MPTVINLQCKVIYSFVELLKFCVPRSFWIATHPNHASAIPSSFVLSVHFIFQFSSLMKRLNSAGPSTVYYKTALNTCNANYLEETYKKYLKVNYWLALLNELTENNPSIIYTELLFTRKLTVQDCRGWQDTFINTSSVFCTAHCKASGISLQYSSNEWILL